MFEVPYTCTVTAASTGVKQVTSTRTKLHKIHHRMSFVSPYPYVHIVCETRRQRRTLSWTHLMLHGCWLNTGHQQAKFTGPIFQSLPLL
jgi:hypothetical protein